MKATDLHCVSITNPSKLSAEVLEKKSIKRELDELVVRLHMAKPNWRYEFDATGWGTNHLHLSILQDREVLGTVEWAYLSYKSGYGYAVHNKRIAASMERKHKYTTVDQDKAFKKIVKMFGLDSVAEIAAQAVEQAQRVVGNNLHSKRSDGLLHHRTVVQAAHKYVMGVGFDHFLAYIASEVDPQLTESINTAMNRQAVAESELKPIAEVSTALEANKSVVIVRTDSGYVCRRGTETTVRTDADIPEDWRGKLGLLKLVEREHYIENVGCRVNENVFVVLVEE